MKHQSVLCSAVLASLVGTAPEVSAQTTAPEQEGGVEEVIVMARKRQESILQVPVIETVLARAQLENQQVVDLNDVASMAPGILFGEAPLEIGTTVSIRGIGTTSLDPGIDQSVSLNLDGLQLTQGMAYSAGLFDMAQVEILKGPQALFFGKNAPAGVVSIRTADPGDTLEIIGRVGYEFEAHQWRTEGILSGPVSDTLGLRLAASYSDSDGYFFNDAIPLESTGARAPNHRFGASTQQMVRGTLLWEPTEALTARIKLNHTEDKVDDGAPFQLASCPEGTFPYAGIPFYGVEEDCKGDRHLNVVLLDPAAFPGIFNDGKQFTDSEQNFGTVEIDYDFVPELTLTSVTGYYDLETSALIGATYAGQAAPTIAAQKAFSRTDFTQEFRLNSEYSGPLNFSLGAFYQDGEIKNDIDLLGNSNYSFPALLAGGTHDVDIRSASAFGQLRYRPVPAVEVAAGARYTDEKRSDDAMTIDAFGVFTGVPGTPTYPELPKLHSKNWSPELTLTYTVNPDTTLFASLKQAYKSGSYNLIAPVNPGRDNSFGDERARGGEIGLKMRLADRQLYLNLATYLYKYKGLQVGVNEAAEGQIPVLRTLNAGSSKIYGVDFDFRFAPHAVPGLDVHGAVNWNHARFTAFENATCYGGQTVGEGCNLLPVPATQDQIDGGFYSIDPETGEPVIYTSQDLTGEPLTRAPAWQMNLGTGYERALGDRMLLGFGVDGQYTTKYLANLGPRDDFYQDAYFKLNANVRLEAMNQRWEVALIGSNLTNEYSTSFCTNLNYAGGQSLPGSVSGAPITGAAGSDELHCTFDPGRQTWLRLTLRY